MNPLCCKYHIFETRSVCNVSLSLNSNTVMSETVCARLAFIAALQDGLESSDTVIFYVLILAQTP
jgi:hypothetical protein